MKRPTTLIPATALGLLLSLAFAPAQAQELPLSVRIDMAIVQLETSIVAQDHQGVLAQIDALRALDPAAGDGELLYFEAESALATGDLDRGERSLTRFLAEVGRESTNYQPALKLMIDMPAKRAAAAEEQRKAAEEARKAEEARLARERIERAEAEAARQREQEAEQVREAQRLEEQRKRRLEVFLERERDLGLSTEEWVHVRWYLARAWGSSRDWRPTQTRFLLETERDWLRRETFKTNFPYLDDDSRSYLNRNMANHILAQPLSPEILSPAAFTLISTGISNPGGDWIYYRGSSGRCHIESPATSWTRNSLMTRPVMSFSAARESTGDLIYIELVYPNPFQSGTRIDAIVDGEFFPLRNNNGSVMPAQRGTGSDSSVVRAIRAAKSGVTIRGTASLTNAPIEITFSAWGFTAAFRAMMAECDRPGLLTWIE